MLKKVERLEINDNQNFLTRVLFSENPESSHRELDLLFGELNNGVIITDEQFKIRYTNSIFQKLGIRDGQEPHLQSKITELFPLIINESSLVGLYEHLMTKEPCVIETGFLIPRIEKITLSPIYGGYYLFKIIINDLFTDSAANLLRYFPELPFAFCGFRIEKTKNMQIEFFSDNFPELFVQSDDLQGEIIYFEKLIHIEDLSIFLKNIVQIRRQKKGSFVQELRVINANSNQYKWFRLYVSHYRATDKKPLCLAYLQDIQEEKDWETQQEELVSEIIDGERERMAMELHDGLGQKIIALKLNLDILKLKFGESKEINNSSSIITESILQMKSLCYNLAPPDFEKGLLQSVERLFSKLDECSNDIRYSFNQTIFELKKLASQESYNILRIIQEFVSNSQKHSKCTEITCEIGKKNDKIIILLTDNGSGFEFDEINPGFGIKNILKRLQLSNANYEFNSAIGEGTYLYIEL